MRACTFRCKELHTAISAFVILCINTYDLALGAAPCCDLFMVSVQY